MTDFSVPSCGSPKAAEVELSTPIEFDQSGWRGDAVSINRIVISPIERRVETRDGPDWVPVIRLQTLLVDLAGVADICLSL